MVDLTMYSKKFEKAKEYLNLIDLTAVPE